MLGRGNMYVSGIRGVLRDGVPQGCWDGAIFTDIYMRRK